MDIYYEITLIMETNIEKITNAFADFNKAIKNLQKASVNTAYQARKARYAILSKQIGMTVRNENQYSLALLGADQETINSNIPASVYELTISYGSAGRLKEAYETLNNNKPITMKTRIKKFLKRALDFIKKLPEASAYAIHR